MTDCPHPPERHYRWRGSEHGVDDEGEACAECDRGPSSLRPQGSARISPPPQSTIHPRVA